MNILRQTSLPLAIVASLVASTAFVACAETTTSESSGSDDGGAASDDASTAVADAGETSDDDVTEDASADSAPLTEDASATPDASAADADTDTDGGDASAAATYLDIVINEVQSQPTTGYLASDFIELYNRSSEPYTFAAGEWHLTDDDETHLFFVPGGTTIAGHGYLVVLPNEETVPTSTPAPPLGALVCVQDGTNSAPFGLGSSDAVSLYFTGASNPTPATAVDTTTWTAHVVTRARVPDGETWAAVDTRLPTPGAANE